MKSFWKGRGFAFVMVLVLLMGATAAYASEEAVKAVLSDLYDRMRENRNTAELDRLDLLVLENQKAEADKEAAKIFNTGVYEQGFDNTLTRDVNPDEVSSRIEQEKRNQDREPLVREGNLYKAIQSLLLTRSQLQTETRLLALTRDEIAIAEARFAAGIISKADLDDAKAAVPTAQLAFRKLEVSLASAELEVNRLAGTDLDTSLAGGETIALLASLFSDDTRLTEWEKLAQDTDPSLFAKEETLRILDRKLDIAKDFIPDTHSRVVQLQRDREDARLALKSARDSLVVSLRNQLNDRLTANDNLEIARLELDMAKRKQSLAKTRYDAGVANKLDLITADKAVVQAEQAVVSATAACNRVEADLRVLVGWAVHEKEPAAE